MVRTFLRPAVLALGLAAAAAEASEPAQLTEAAGTLPPCRKSPILYALAVPVEGVTSGEARQELLAFGGKGWKWEPKKKHPKKIKQKVQMLGDTWLFDFEHQTWRELAMNAGPEHRWKAGTTQLYGDRVLAMFGGCTDTKTKFVQNDLWVFNATCCPVDGWWRELRTVNAPAKRRGHVMVANSTHIVVVGGKTWAPGNADRCLTDVWALPKEAVKEGSKVEPAWKQGASFPAVCRWGGTGTLLNGPDGRLLLGMFGGRYLHQGRTQHTTASSAYTYFNELWLYDFARDAWYLAPTKGDLPPARDHHGAASLYGDLYIYGGRTQELRTEKSVMRDVWSYSLTEGRWTLRSDGTGPIARYMPGVAAVKRSNETLLAVFAGETLPGSTKRSSMNDLWVYSPTEDRWTELSPSACDRTPMPPGSYEALEQAGLLGAEHKEFLALGFGGLLALTLAGAVRLATKAASARCREDDLLQVDERYQRL